jgi:hypothetical protein
MTKFSDLTRTASEQIDWGIVIFLASIPVGMTLFVKALILALKPLGWLA